MRRSKQYAVIATTESKRFTPQTPGRILLVIQNTGANPANIRVVDETRDDGGNFELAAGDFLRFDQPGTVPQEAINASSELGTTLAVLEGVDGDIKQ